jgi:hypothetical protein
MKIYILELNTYGGITPFSNEERGGVEIIPLFHKYNKFFFKFPSLLQI